LRTKIFAILILIAVVLCPHYANAQQTTSTAKADAEAEAALREKAYQLLETLAGQLGSMQSPENRARIGSNIAGSLWPHNETRARELLVAVQQDINTGLQNAESEDAEDVQTVMVFLKLRMDTVSRITRHDPELAYEFLTATALNPNSKLNDRVKENERAIETQLATQVAASNPELALQLARKVLTHGVSDELQNIFRKLNRKHKEEAAALYKDIVQKLGEVDLANDYQARFFAMSFGATISPPAIDEANYNELINVFVKAAAAQGCNTKMAEGDEHAEACRALAPLMMIVAKANPARSREFAAWKIDASSYFESQTSPYRELEDAATEGTIEDVLALTAKYPQMEDEIRWRAFRKARYDNDMEAAQKIAGSSRDSEWKKRMVAEMETVNAKRSLSKEKIAELEKHVGQIKGGRQQVMFLLAIANQVGAQDRKTAIKFLNQAGEITETISPAGDRIAAQVVTALAYCYLKSDRGLAIMETLVPKLNELVEASAKLDGLDRRYLRDGEWNMSREGALGELLNALADYAAYFAYCDFDRAVSLASQFERTEIRMMAQLKLAQGILAGPVKPLPFGDNDYER
jgi:hypothetical protein